jgi:hypothetical protein
MLLGFGTVGKDAIFAIMSGEGMQSIEVFDFAMTRVAVQAKKSPTGCSKKAGVNVKVQV